MVDAMKNFRVCDKFFGVNLAFWRRLFYGRLYKRVGSWKAMQTATITWCNVIVTIGKMKVIKINVIQGLV